MRVRTIRRLTKYQLQRAIEKRARGESAGARGCEVSKRDVVFNLQTVR